MHSHNEFDAVGIQVGRVGLCLALFAKSDFTPNHQRWQPPRRTVSKGINAVRVADDRFSKTIALDWAEVRDDYFEALRKISFRSPRSMISSPFGRRFPHRCQSPSVKRLERHGLRLSDLVLAATREGSQTARLIKCRSLR